MVASARVFRRFFATSTQWRGAADFNQAGRRSGALAADFGFHHLPGCDRSYLRLSDFVAGAAAVVAGGRRQLLERGSGIRARGKPRQQGALAVGIRRIHCRRI